MGVLPKDSVKTSAIFLIRICLIFRKFVIIRGIGTKLARETVWFRLIIYQVTVSGSIFLLSRTHTLFMIITNRYRF